MDRSGLSPSEADEALGLALKIIVNAPYPDDLYTVEKPVTKRQRAAESSE